MNVELLDVKKAFTHAGKFHADDVFSAALLTIINKDITIERGFCVPDHYDGIVFDIGFGIYDHHQENKKVRENEIPYAAFGLLWEVFGGFILDEDDKILFDEKFVQPLDLNDNTGVDNELAKLISKFNPSWDEATDENICFEEAKQVAIQLLQNEFRYIKSSKRAKVIMEEEISNAKDNILVMSQFVPWKKGVEGTGIEFVIYPSKRGGFVAQGVTKSEFEGGEGLYYEFPKEWRGKTKDELKTISGIETLNFCHNSGFLLSAGTVDDCLKACEITKNYYKSEVIVAKEV